MTPVESGRLVEVDATVRVDGENIRVVMSTTLPEDGSSMARLAAMRSWSITIFAADGGGSGTAQMSRADALRALYLFEPSGAHTLSDRLRALRMMVRFVGARR